MSFGCLRTPTVVTSETPNPTKLTKPAGQSLRLASNRNSSPADARVRRHAQTSRNQAGGFYPRMIRRHGFLLARNLIKRDRDTFVAFQSDHDVVMAFGQEHSGRCPEPGAEQSIKGRRFAAALDMTE